MHGGSERGRYTRVAEGEEGAEGREECGGGDSILVEGNGVTGRGAGTTGEIGESIFTRSLRGAIRPRKVCRKMLARK